MSVENPKAFKHLVNEKTLKKYLSTFNISKNEITRLEKELLELELRDRVRLISRELKNNLAMDYPQALKSLRRIIDEQSITKFELWPATEFIQIHGLDHIEESLEVLYELTQKFTAEFAIRPFINTHGDLIYRKLVKWNNHPNEHIRRWISEGTRPRLPWGERLPKAIQDPTLGLEILEYLKFDRSLYVRKSVANHLNDIAKDHPDLVIKTLKRWKMNVPKGYEKEFQFILNRSLRTLIKEGNPKALSLLGIRVNELLLKVDDLRLKKKLVLVGEDLNFSFNLSNKTSKSVNYVLDYVIGFQRSNGNLSKKVFKLKKGKLGPKEKLIIVKKQSFRQVTTRKIYPGKHSLAIKLNGKTYSETKFNVK